MTTSRDSGDPDLRLGGFSLWVYGRERPSSDDYWDGNWLIVKWQMRAGGASVKVTGSFLRTPEIDTFARELRSLYKSIVGTAKLACMEPNLDVALEGNKLGQVTATISITPDHLYQSHRFVFDLDQTWIGQAADSCDAILKRFPIKG